MTLLEVAQLLLFVMLVGLVAAVVAVFAGANFAVIITLAAASGLIIGAAIFDGPRR